MSDLLRELRALVLDSHSKAFASYDYDQGFQEMRTFVLGHLDAMLAAEPEPDPAPIQKPQPDWGRKGTQPTGTLGNPPPPNGRPVATKPTNAPAPYVVTDAMVEAAWAEFQRVCMWRDTPNSELRSWGPTSMRAAIEAALRVKEQG